MLPLVEGWIILDEALVLGETAENEKRKFLAEAGSKMQVKGKRKKSERPASPERPVVRVETVLDMKRKSSTVIQT